MLANLWEYSVEEPRSNYCLAEVCSLMLPFGYSVGFMLMLQARRKELGHRRASWVTGCVILTVASEICSLGYIYYILFDPERGLGLLVATKKKKKKKREREGGWEGERENKREGGGERERKTN